MEHWGKGSWLQGPALGRSGQALLPYSYSPIVWGYPEKSMSPWKLRQTWSGTAGQHKLSIVLQLGSESSLKGIACLLQAWMEWHVEQLSLFHTMQGMPVKTRARHVAGDRTKARTWRALCISLGSLDLIHRQWRPWKALNKEAMGTYLHPKSPLQC